MGADPQDHPTDRTDAIINETMTTRFIARLRFKTRVRVNALRVYLGETGIERKHAVTSRMTNAFVMNTPLALTINGLWDQIRDTVERKAQVGSTE